MSAYQTAINLTTLTIDRRANNYRNLVVAVVLVSLGSIGWAIFAPSLSALSGFFLLLPVCGLYLFIDGKLLNDWRSRLLEGWVRGEIDFQAFCQAVDAIPTLPKSTLQGMIATLPSAGDLLTEQGISPITREAISAVVMTIHTCRSDAAAIKVFGFAVAGGSLMVAAALRTWQPLLGMVVVLALPLLRKWLRLWRLRCSKERTPGAQQQLDFNAEKYLEIVTCLDWEPILASEKYNFLATVRPEA